MMEAAAPVAVRTAPAEDAIEVSIVMPCLNEADTIATCIQKAQRALREAGMSGEVIVADNGSTDQSRAIAEALGARVVPVPARGYGSALMGGIEAARGQYVIMGDADDSYDFGEVPKFVEQLRRATPWCRVAACRPAAARFSPTPCPRSIAGSAIPPCRSWPGSGSGLPCTTCIAGCAVSPSRCTGGWACGARGWSSRPR